MTNNKLLIANTCFERELTELTPSNLIHFFQSHPIFLQLQFLPLLYGNPQDLVGITAFPEEAFQRQLSNLRSSIPKLYLLDDKTRPVCSYIDSWGASKTILNWGKKRNIEYTIPNWKTILTVNSKAFSFTNSPKLPQATLLYEEKETLSWLKSVEGPKVLKTCFGVSGRGHLIIEKDELNSRSLKFLQAEWQHSLPVIAEPWVERALDFSTQWHIDKEGDIEHLGVVQCENDLKGSYRSNTACEKETLFGSHLHFLEEHMKIAKQLLHLVASQGYFGNVGIDAMIYQLPNKKTFHLHPIVEINARKTMGWLALQMGSYYKTPLTLRFTSTSSLGLPLLPWSLKRKDGRMIHFQKQLFLEHAGNAIDNHLKKR